MKIAMIQICSALEPEKNLKKINQLIKQAKQQEPELDAVFLPEVFYSMSDGDTVTPFLVEEGNEHFLAIKELAVQNKVALLGGTAATKLGASVVNRSFNFNAKGELIAQYDKTHLFSINLKQEKTVLDEAQVYTPGSELTMFDWGGFKIGLSVCFDLRFPELYRRYFSHGVNLFTVASAFTIPTGKAHWLTLLKARAIENQAYVVAVDQWGVHNKKISTWGHSYVIDPWGEVVAECGEGETFALCELDIKKVQKVRQRMDVSQKLFT